MKKFLKYIVVFLGILILCLLTIVTLTIFYKYKNDDNKIINNIKLAPKIDPSFSIRDFHMNKNEVYLYLENTSNNSHLIRVYDRKNGKLISEITIK